MQTLPVSLTAQHSTPTVSALQGISAIQGVQADHAQSPLWQQLKSGHVMTAIVGEPLSPADSAKTATPLYQVLLQNEAGDTLPLILRLPERWSYGQPLQLQWLPHAAESPSVRWQAISGAQARFTAGLAGELATLGTTQPLFDSQFSTAGLPDGAAKASQVALSVTGKTLQHWLASQSELQSGAMVQANGVLSDNPAHAPRLAMALEQAFSQSGLFYESHLKEATLGLRPWQQLHAEPQNRPDFSAPAMLAQQLQALEQQRVQWQGEVWSGQAMQWTVTERTSTPPSTQATTTPALFSNFQLQLPRLGALSVRLTCVDGRFSIRVQATEADSCQRMQAARWPLAQRLQEAGLHVDGLQVVQEAVDVA